MIKELKFNNQVLKNPQIRFLKDMAEVIMDKDWLKTAGDPELYYMYRDLAKNETDRQKIEQANLRFDITVIPAQMMGKEFVKTAGHNHSLVDQTNLSYTEIYEVLSGQAHYLIQKVKGEEIEDICLIKAAKGDKVIIPPGYGHVTINSSTEELKSANWVCKDCLSVYDQFKKRQGAGYYLTQENNQIQLIKNPNYQKVPPIRELQPANYPELGLDKEKEMYGLVNNLEKLDFLKSPQNYQSLWQKILS